MGLIINIHRLYILVRSIASLVFFFPTHVELSIRRISSVVITNVSIYIFLILLLAAWLDNMDFNTASDIVLHLDLCPEVSPYIIARAVTSVLKFTSLTFLFLTSFCPVVN